MNAWLFGVCGGHFGIGRPAPERGRELKESGPRLILRSLRMNAVCSRLYPATEGADDCTFPQVRYANPSGKAVVCACARTRLRDGFQNLSDGVSGRHTARADQPANLASWVLSPASQEAPLASCHSETFAAIDEACELATPRHSVIGKSTSSVSALGLEQCPRVANA